MKQLLILSGKGGTGKTTVASAFIRLSKAKAFADCDVDAPNLHLTLSKLEAPYTDIYYGMPKAVINQDRCTSCGLCLEHCRFDAIWDDDGYKVDPFACEGCSVCEMVCPSGAVTMEEADSGRMMLYDNGERIFSTARLNMGNGTSGKLVTEVKVRMTKAAKHGDLSIVDGSPGIGCPVISSISGAHMVLIVAEPSISGLSDLKRIVETARLFGVILAVCINKYDTHIGMTESIEGFCQNQGLDVVGRIPFDWEAVEAVNSGMTVVDRNCSAGVAVKEIYDKTMQLIMD